MILSICVDQLMILEHKFRTICPTSSVMELLISSNVSLDLFPCLMIRNDVVVGIYGLKFRFIFFFFSTLECEGEKCERVKDLQKRYFT